MAQINKRHRLIDQLLTPAGLPVLEDFLQERIAFVKKNGTDDDLEGLFKIREYLRDVKAEASDE